MDSCLRIVYGTMVKLARKWLVGTLMIVSTTIVMEGCKDGEGGSNPGPSAGAMQAGEGGAAGAGGTPDQGGRSGSGASAAEAGSGEGGNASSAGEGGASAGGVGDTGGVPMGGASNEGGEGGAAGSGDAPSLDGATVHLEARSPRTRPISARVAATVGAGVEFPNFEDHPLSGFFLADVDVNVSGHTIELVYDTTLLIPNATFNGYVIEFSDLGGDVISGVAVDPTTSSTLLAADVTLSGSSIDVNIANLSVTPGATLLLQVTF
jgi:hypothetical protein